VVSNSPVQVFAKNNSELPVVVVPNTTLPHQTSLHLSFLLPDPLSQQIGFICNRVSYKGTNVCDELTSAGLKFPEGDGIVWLCSGDPTLEQVLLKSNGLINRAPETLMLKSVVILTMKH